MDVVQYLLWCLCESVVTCWHACCVVFSHLSLIFQHAAQFWRLDCENIADKDNEWLTRRLSSALHVKVRLKIFNQLSTWNLETANWHVHPATHKTYSVAQHCTEQPSCLLFLPHFLHLPYQFRSHMATPQGRRHCQLHQSVCMNGKSTCCEEEARLVRDLAKNSLRIAGPRGSGAKGRRMLPAPAAKSSE